jgi:hypothetical protein
MILRDLRQNFAHLCVCITIITCHLLICTLPIWVIPRTMQDGQAPFISIFFHSKIVIDFYSHQEKVGIILSFQILEMTGH